jgi:hypothetical protein
VLEERGDVGVRRGRGVGQAHADGQVDAVGAEFEWAVGLHDPRLDLGMGGHEVRQARDQPLHGEGRQARDHQGSVAGSGGLGQGRLDLVQRQGQGLGQGQARLAQGQAFARAFGQGDAEVVLKLADLAADRPVGHAQLIGRQGHPATPAERLEGAQGVERRKRAGGHVTKPHRCPLISRYSGKGNRAIRGS